MRTGAFPILAVAILCAQPVLAQSPDLRRAGLSRQEAQRIQDLIESERTLRFDGDALVRRGEVIDGPVFVNRGILTVAGLIRGELVVLDGDVVLESGAEITGDVTVVGGRLEGQSVARLSGTVTEYGEGFGLLAQARTLHDGRRELRGDWRDEWNDDRHRGDRYREEGWADLAVRVGDNYNRVEGLPVHIGPDFRTGGANPTRLEALGVWRTDVGPLTDTERMGYLARLEQFFGGRQAFRVGATVRSTMQPIESWTVTHLEASLSAAMLHEDQRDYFERKGWSAYLRYSPVRSPLDIVVEYRDEEHRSVASRDPWTLFNRDDPWRDQPLIGEGKLRLVNGSARVDTRRGGDFVRSGWYAQADIVRGLDGTLQAPVFAGPLALERVDYDASGLSAGLLDVRHYAPTGWHGSLALRVVAGGSLDGKALAPQFQHALGGAGTLPGYSLMSVDCGARRFSVRQGTDQFFASYGCDRFALLQAEYRGGLDFRFGDDPKDDIDVGVDWTLFFDAARGWALGDDPNRANTDALYDAGAGIVLGGVGIYGAVPLTGQDRGLRLFVRLGSRF